jgi:hypothetical protein
MPRAILLSTFKPKPDADRRELEKLIQLARERFGGIAGCVEASVFVGTPIDHDDINNAHSEGYTQLVIFKDQASVLAWLSDPQDLFSDEEKADFGEMILEFSLPKAYTEVE